MRFLVVEDEFISRTTLQKMLLCYADCDVAVNGQEAIDAFLRAISDKDPYDLICLDIMLPGIDGQQVLKFIRQKEQELGISGPDEVKVIMVTAVDSPKDVVSAYHHGGCATYMVKPVQLTRLQEQMREFGLID